MQDEPKPTSRRSTPERGEGRPPRGPIDAGSGAREPLGAAARSRRRPRRALRRLLERAVGLFGERLAAPRHELVEIAPDDPREAIYALREPRFRVPTTRCYYPYGFSYAPGAWHPFSATVRQLERDPTLAYEDSELRRFYDRFQPADAREVLLEPQVVVPGDDSRLRALSLREWFPPLPWTDGLAPVRGEAGLGALHGQQGFGPVSRAKGELEFRRLARLHASIVRHGYRPVPGGRAIAVYFLIAGDDYRLVVRAGLHRMAVLSALGHTEVPVTFAPGLPRAIHLSDLARWPLVRSGLYPPALAERIFRRYFEPPDTKARALGLVAPPGAPVVRAAGGRGA